MVAKFKNSFLKNGFQLFCYKHLLARDVIHNTITAPPNPSATVNDDLKKLSSSSPSLNNPAFAQNRLSKRDKRASTRATAGRSASLNIKPPSVTSPNKNGYVMIDASSNEEQPADQEEITVNGLIKSSKSHPNFTVTTHNSSPVKDAANNELDPNSRLSTKSSPTSNSDLMVVSDFAAENHSNSSELSSTAGSSGSTSSPSEDSISNKRQSKSINNNNASVYNSGQILSKSSSMHHQAPNANSEIKKTYLPNGAVLIDPPSINRAVNLNRYSMPIIQSPSKDLIHSDTQLDENPLYGNRNSSDFVQLNKNHPMYPNSQAKQSRETKKHNSAQQYYHNHHPLCPNATVMSAAGSASHQMYSSMSKQQQQQSQIPFNSTNFVYYDPKQHNQSPSVQTTLHPKRSLKSSMNNKSVKMLNGHGKQHQHHQRSMSVNSKKVVRFADSLGLELESFIPFNHANSARYPATYHYQYYQRNPTELMNLNKNIRPAHPSNAVESNGQNVYLNQRIHAPPPQISKVNSMRAKNSEFLNNSGSPASYGTMSFYDDMMSHVIKKGGESNTERGAVYEIATKSPTGFSPLVANTNNGSSTSNQNITITTRINNGKLESEV